MRRLYDLLVPSKALQWGRLTRSRWQWVPVERPAFLSLPDDWPKWPDNLVTECDHGVTFYALSGEICHDCERRMHRYLGLEDETPETP